MGLMGFYGGLMRFYGIYPLVNVYISTENHDVQWINQLYMAIFNSYVKLSEGKHDDEWL